MLVTATGAIAIALWVHGKVGVGTVAMALPLSWQIINIAGWVAMRITEIFENIGVVQEGMMTIARPIGLLDRPDARAADGRRAARSCSTMCGSATAAKAA